jgi:hypothetical protein
MATPTLADLKERMKQREKNNKNKGSFNKNSYPFFTMKEGESARIRILLDKNHEDNPMMYYVEHFTHLLDMGDKKKKIPCLKHQFNEDCPICDLSAEHYNQGDTTTGKYYYRDKKRVIRAIVMEDPLPPDEETGETYVGKTVNVYLSYQLMEVIDNQILELDAPPWDLDNGYDFIIKKTSKGEYAGYDVASQFARKSTKVPQEYRDNMELIDLSETIPEKPSLEKVQAMLDAHIDGVEYDENHGDSGSSSDNSSDKGMKLPTRGGKSSLEDDNDEQDEQDERDDRQSQELNESGSDDSDSDEDEVVVSGDDDDDDDDDDLDLDKILNRSK